MRSDPPPNAQRHREEARRIRRAAKRITDEKIRRQMLDIADQYDRLAESVELTARHQGSP
jgi:hypothetical protein